ncbi:MAG: DUF427 domain-containing protein [Sandaracinaceae bacterium]
MARATWNGAVLAESDDVEIVEGNVYFPPSAIAREHFQESAHHTVCGWKGTASYYDVVVGGERNANAAWYYPSTKDAAKNIEGYVAFWNGVTVER